MYGILRFLYIFSTTSLVDRSEPSPSPYVEELKVKKAMAREDSITTNKNRQCGKADGLAEDNTPK